MSGNDKIVEGAGSVKCIMSSDNNRKRPSITRFSGERGANSRISAQHWLGAIATLVLLFSAVPLMGQIETGGNSLNLNGNVGLGYSGDYGNTQNSSHDLGLNGMAQLNGFYFNPNFLNYNVVTSYNRSEENSGNGSITDSTVIDASAGIFGGSHFPGFVSFSKSYDGTNNYGLVGIPGFTTSGDSTAFGVGWAVNYPNAPSLSAQYYVSDSSSSLFGTTDEYYSQARNFNMNSNYRWDGWNLTARFTDLHTANQFPEFLSNDETGQSDSHSDTFFTNASHKLPFNGSLGIGYTWDHFDGDGNGVTTTGSNQTFDGTATFSPWIRLSSVIGAEYDTNLNGYVEQQLINAGSTNAQVNLGNSSHLFSLFNQENVQIWGGLSGAFNFNHIEEFVYGQSISSNHFSGILNFRYVKPFLGSFVFFGGVVDQSSDAGHQGTGMVAGVNFERTIDGYDLTANFSYDQDLQTVLANQLTSTYTLMAGSQHRFGRRLLWINHFNEYRTGFSAIQGSGNHTENFGTNLGYKGYGVGVSYGQSAGTALLAQNGFVPLPVTIAPVIPGNEYLLINGKSFGANVSVEPLRLWTFSASLTKGESTTSSSSLYSSNSTKIINAYTQYQLRKITISGGYTKVTQGISAISAFPVNYSSFYFGIQRWFHAF